jgi:hypothetical protein
MGGSFSSLGSPTGSDVKNILNVILREMFLRSDLVDLYSLADPERCSKYIVVASDAIKKLFMSINLEPTAGKKGEIYFQKIEGLVKANPMRAQQDQVCKQLAFFFIRIFQIYAALTLSIMDSDLPQADPYVSHKDGPRGKGFIYIPPPDLKGFAAPATRKWFGGALTDAPFIPVAAGQPVGSGNYYLTPDRAGIYKILNLFLLVPTDNAPVSTSEMRFQDSDMTISQDDLYDIGADRAGTRRVKNFSDRATVRPTIMYNFKANDKYRNIGGQLILGRLADGIEVKLENVSLVDNPSKRVEVTGKLNNRRPGDENPVSDSGKQLTGLLHELFNKAFEQIEPPIFSGVDWLKKYRIIASLEGRVRIEGTKVTINNPRNFARKRHIHVNYTGELRMDGRSKTIRMEAKLVIEKLDRSSLENIYRVKVDFKDLTTEPSDLKDHLERHERWREREFSTGDADNSTPLSEKGETVGAFIQYAFDKLLKGVSEGRSDGGIRYDREGRPKPYDSGHIDEQFKIKRLWEALAQDPPVKAHCVARAVQLLNVAAIRDPRTGEAYSSVCRVKFPYVKDGSLPEPGKSITTEEGVYALAMLFVDGLAKDTFMPKVTATPEFAAFRQRLKYSFERYKTLEETPQVDSLGKVTEKQMPFCRDHSDDRVKVSGGLMRELRGKANELMQRQTTHVAQVMRIMFKLFDEKEVRAGSLAMNSNVMAGGMEAVNKLAEEARSLLITYYGDCEKTYKEGLYALYNKHKDDPASLQFVQDPSDARAR